MAHAVFIAILGVGMVVLAVALFQNRIGSSNDSRGIEIFYGILALVGAAVAVWVVRLLVQHARRSIAPDETRDN